MKTTERFDEAVNKLYTAFHKNTLNAFSCAACAVGNMVGHGSWSMHLVGRSKCGALMEIDDYGFSRAPYHKDYNEEEIKKVEEIFLTAWLGRAEDGYDKDLQFKGLIAVINYLAELGGIESIDDQYNKFNEVLKNRELCQI